VNRSLDGFRLRAVIIGGGFGGLARAGVLARWVDELGTRNRSGRVILEGVGAGGALAQLARADEPAAGTGARR
jgi:predicted naringenin-chalcone synthase